MADPAPTGTVVPVVTDGGGSTTPEYKVPDGKVLIDATEHQQWQRQREQLGGLTRFHGEATKRGFSKDSDFGAYDKLTTTLKGRKLSMDEAVAILAGQEREAPAQEGGVDRSSIEKILSDGGYLKKEALDEARTLDRATLEHERASEKESALIQKHISELLGDKPLQKDRYLLEHAIKAELFEPKNLEDFGMIYPQGHPLRLDARKPMGEAEAAKFMEKVKKNLAVEEGSDMSKIGKAAAKGKPTATPAGNRAGQGKPEDTPTSGRPSDVIRAAVERLSR